MDEKENINEGIPESSYPDISESNVSDETELSKTEVRTAKKKKRTISYFYAAVLMILTAVLVFQITYLAVGQMYKREINSLLSSGISNAKINEINQIYKDHFIYDFT